MGRDIAMEQIDIKFFDPDKIRIYIDENGELKLRPYSRLPGKPTRYRYFMIEKNLVLSWITKSWMMSAGKQWKKLLMKHISSLK